MKDLKDEGIGVEDVEGGSVGHDGTIRAL
jgi:hypothetical protein